MKYAIYQLADGRRWDTKRAQWLREDAPLPPDGELIMLATADGESDVPYLIRTLEFYKYPLGDLAWSSPRALKEELAELDADYLPPRTLADLVKGDPIAQERWDEHERKAKPLRERIAELEQIQASGADPTEPQPEPEPGEAVGDSDAPQTSSQEAS